MANALHTGPQGIRALVAPMLGLGLLSLVFLGSPGCGCGDTLPTRISPSPCCCTLSWAAPDTPNLVDADIRVDIVGQSVGLGAIVSPSVIPEVNGGDIVEFLVCVEQDHPPGAFLQLEFREVGSNTLWGGAALSYVTRCEPDIDPSGDTRIWSETCGDIPDCCCDFVWIPEQTNLFDATVDIVILNQTVGLNAVITPSTLISVNSGVQQGFTVCVDVNHSPGASIDIEFQNASGDESLGDFTLVYDERCVPRIIEGIRTTVFSPDCGTVPQCCCNFEWIPESNLDGATIDIVVLSESSGLNAVITPTTLVGVNTGEPQSFEVCVDVDHPIGASIDIEFQNASGTTALGSFTLVYNVRCEPTIIEGVRTTVFSPDCGGVPQCCCELQWINTSSAGGSFDVRIEFADVDPSLNPTVGPPVVTGVGPLESALFVICVDFNHDLLAQMNIRLIDNQSNQELALLPVIYDFQCIPLMGDPSGLGVFNFLCLENETSVTLTDD